MLFQLARQLAKLQNALLLILPACFAATTTDTHHTPHDKRHVHTMIAWATAIHTRTIMELHYAQHHHQHSQTTTHLAHHAFWVHHTLNTYLNHVSNAQPTKQCVTKCVHISQRDAHIIHNNMPDPTKPALHPHNVRRFRCLAVILQRIRGEQQVETNGTHPPPPPPPPPTPPHTICSATQHTFPCTSVVVVPPTPASTLVRAAVLQNRGAHHRVKQFAMLADATQQAVEHAQFAAAVF